MLLCISTAVAGGVRNGMTRLEVEEALGRPKAVLESNGRQVLLYPNGGRVELSGGKLVYSTKVTVDVGTPALESTPAPVANAEVVVPSVAPVASVSPVSLAKPASTAVPVAEKDEMAVYTPAQATAQSRLLDKSLEDMSRAHSQPGVLTHPDPARFWIELLLSSLVQLLAAVVVLKFAFAWAEVHADWGQMWIPALADTVATMAVRSLAYILCGATELFQMDNGIAFLVLLWVLMKTTHACTWPRAVGVAMTTKMVGVGVRLLVGALAAHAIA